MLICSFNYVMVILLAYSEHLYRIINHLHIMLWRFVLLILIAGDQK